MELLQRSGGRKRPSCGIMWNPANSFANGPATKRALWDPGPNRYESSWRLVEGKECGRPRRGFQFAGARIGPARRRFIADPIFFIHLQRDGGSPAANGCLGITLFTEFTEASGASWAMRRSLFRRVRLAAQTLSMKDPEGRPSGRGTYPSKKTNEFGKLADQTQDRQGARSDESTASCWQRAEAGDDDLDTRNFRPWNFTGKGVSERWPNFGVAKIPHRAQQDTSSGASALSKLKIVYFADGTSLKGALLDRAGRRAEAGGRIDARSSEDCNLCGHS